MRDGGFIGEMGIKCVRNRHRQISNVHKHIYCICCCIFSCFYQQCWKYTAKVFFVFFSLCAALLYICSYIVEVIFFPDHSKCNKSKPGLTGCKMKVSILRWATLCCFSLVRKKRLQFVRKGTKLGGKREMAEEVRNNQFHHSDTWLPPCGKPRWQMLRVRVKGKVLGNDMWNRGQTVEPPCIADVLHCAIVGRQHWAKQCEDTLFQSIWQSSNSPRPFTLWGIAS